MKRGREGKGGGKGNKDSENQRRRMNERLVKTNDKRKTKGGGG